MNAPENAPDLQALAHAADDEAVDAMMQRRHGVESFDDPSGLLGQPSGTPPADASEDEQFEAYMKTHFRGSVGSKT